MGVDARAIVHEAVARTGQGSNTGTHMDTSAATDAGARAVLGGTSCARVPVGMRASVLMRECVYAPA